jgi:hypothetical protein
LIHSHILHFPESSKKEITQRTILWHQKGNHVIFHSAAAQPETHDMSSAEIEKARIKSLRAYHLTRKTSETHRKTIFLTWATVNI